MDEDLQLGPKIPPGAKFKVVGLLPSKQYQKCRFMVEKLHECYPKDFQAPELRGMLNVDWDEYLTKMKRRHGKSYYLLEEPVAVYLDGAFMGGDKDLTLYVSQKYNFEINLDLLQIGEQEVIKYFQNLSDKYKLYNDLVPITCDNFLNRCVSSEEGYKTSKVHRIALHSWIQCGGNNLKHIHMPCENYAVPHNRRGVLSMCNKRRHEENSTQFFITLEAADWMDYNYVAFGQLLQGGEVLAAIEKVPTYFQSPQRKVVIVQSGEFTLCSKFDEDYAKALNPPYETLFHRRESLIGDDIDSVLSLRGYKAGKYCLPTDLKPYLPFKRFSLMFETYLRTLEKEEVEEEDEHKVPSIQPKIEDNMEEEDSYSMHNVGGSSRFYFKLKGPRK